MTQTLDMVHMHLEYHTISNKVFFSGLVDWIILIQYGLKDLFPLH